MIPEMSMNAYLFEGRQMYYSSENRQQVKKSVSAIPSTFLDLQV